MLIYLKVPLPNFHPQREHVTFGSHCSRHFM